MLKVRYQDGVDGLTPNHFTKVRQQWNSPPSAELTLASMGNMNAVIVSLNEEDEVIGFICGMSDQLLTLYIWDMEVIDDYANQNIENELIQRMIQAHGQLYQINANPIASLQACFEANGFTAYEPSEAMAMTKMNLSLQDSGIRQSM